MKPPRLDLSRLDAFERTVYADVLAVALLLVMLAVLWTAGVLNN
jgi:hypothetical protein